MTNPCDICILKVICTKVCYEKNNYTSLVTNAVRLNKGYALFHKFLEVKINNSKEITKIYNRKHRKENYLRKGDCNIDTISRRVRKSFSDAKSAVRSKHY